ncbi:DUF2195 family protein [Caballeronia sp. NCTM5]|uniref:DUF2195 family protein n=1 Tax=Caballeronia sp. NCTM5 TaxID=2921755 RepID=UPI002027F3E0|nr:DUF2195 family protein [Caballeronia sp. NCTM5]
MYRGARPTEERLFFNRATLWCAATALLMPVLCNAKPTIDIENSVSQCIDVKLETPVQKEGNLVANAHISMNRELSECGCTSRQIAYHVEDAKGNRLARERFTLLGGARRQLTLGRKNRAQANPPLKLWFGCAGA